MNSIPISLVRDAILWAMPDAKVKDIESSMFLFGSLEYEYSTWRNIVKATEEWYRGKSRSS